MVNVSGHRLSTAEIEAALIEHHAVAEAAVVGVSDELTGQAVNAFVAVKDGNEVNDGLRKEFVMQVRKSIGPFAAPKAIYVVPDLPKTRSGKIMRRILRKILAGEEDQLGDTTTVRTVMRRPRRPRAERGGNVEGSQLTDGVQLSDPSVVERIIRVVHEDKRN